jgi:hypothetical protein
VCQLELFVGEAQIQRDLVRLPGMLPPVRAQSGADEL